MARVALGDRRNLIVSFQHRIYPSLADLLFLLRQALMVIAHKSTSAEIGILRKLFQKFDSRRDGSISYEEFCEALATSGHSEEDLRDMFDAVVRPFGSGWISI